MSALSYIKRAAEFPSLNPKDFSDTATISLITNFTDGLLQKLIIGLCLEQDIYPTLSAEGYKQYHFSLAKGGKTKKEEAPDITFVVFDVHPYATSEFTVDPAHVDEVLENLRTYIQITRGHVVITTLPLPLQNAYRNHYEHDPLYQRVVRFNEGLVKLAADFPNVSIASMDRLLRSFGETHARDMRSLAAFDIPFTNEFSLMLCEELTSYLFALKGRGKKCLVVDLDNTLWGGVVGEVGVQGIVMGPVYPGNSYLNFQHALLSFFNRGIILAIASRNNKEDVDEVFAKHPAMVLRKNQFGSIQVGWRRKSEMLRDIAEELNIGLDSLVFLDDDAANREEVRASLPMVAVPEMPIQPEEYARFVLSLPYFNQLSLTAEDLAKGKMYSEERERREVMTESGDDYLQKLGIEIEVFENAPAELERLAQLSQKTNQCNLTTRRYSRADLERLIKEGASVFGASVKDRFGAYGTVLLGIVKRSGTDAELDTFLMSCRTMGRGVEFRVLDHIIETLHARGVTRLTASFLPTKKNEPIKELLPQMGFSEVNDKKEYALMIETYRAHKPECVTSTLSLVALNTHE